MTRRLSVDDVRVVLGVSADHVDLAKLAAVAEATQRLHELNEAIRAARALQARLEMCGARVHDVAWVVALRHDLAREIGEVEVRLK